MRALILTFLIHFFIEHRLCVIVWSRGVVYYAISQDDYDSHSQDIIVSTFDKLQREICVKFFKVPVNYSGVKVLYISNAHKKKDCELQQYDFGKNVVDMSIGYNCLNERDITRLITDMLRKSINPQAYAGNSFEEQDEKNTATLLSFSDRNFINTHYHDECAVLNEKKPPNLRKHSDRYLNITSDSENYYKDKIWPLGIVFYGEEPGLNLTHKDDWKALQHAITTIEQYSCVVFQYVRIDDDALIPLNYLWFASDPGETMPRFGFTPGRQTLQLSAMVHGAPGHTAHTLNQLMRILGIPMMSNRYDRDSYVKINWNNVEKGMEHYLDVLPFEALLGNNDNKNNILLPYDYTSVTHAPVNYMCRDCSLGQQTVTPMQDTLWQKSMTMGHRTDLSSGDVEALNTLYAKQCESRNFGAN